ncbi:cag pathogenicity island protein [Mycobacterium sp. 852014-52450_SCH5900713]|uniref:CaiB/BaiF CoA transferase family protein n=1 Tax=Mycobacterium sp. 852014-52450_SCH5900713 TaxID=1834116 RepID=UPI000800F976|nr:CoA transferase [Mycobacterium sp. 852014-52450_SCH5900713]OBF94341.1 cag pathogenicity island protein [Mycobacterium sp. 852014-52450_SCH5900713]
MNALRGVRVVEWATEISGPYCTKLFADLGAEVIKIEAPNGDPFRRRTFGDRSDADALFKFLNAGKRSVVGTSLADLEALIVSADVFVDSLGPGALDREALLRRAPHLVIVALSPYGLTGPYRDRPSTEFTIQAESGTLALRGRPDQPPIQAGGRIFEWVMASYAAVGALGALRRAQLGGAGEIIDCSLLETCHLSASGFADLYHELAGRPPLTLPARQVEIPSIEPTADGWVGFNTNTRQQFESFLAMIGRLDLLDDDPAWALATTRWERRDEWNQIVREWTTQRSTDEIVALASDLRIPVSPVNNGQTVLDHPQFAARGVWGTYADGSFTHPLAPYQINGRRPAPTAGAPPLGEMAKVPAHNGIATAADRAPGLPLDGVRILDATAWWAGPSSTHILAALGAEVIHLESTHHPDGARMAAAAFANQPEWWERSGMYLATNTNKRGLTLDLSSSQGRELLFRLVKCSDILVENFSPRVFDNFAITWETVSELNPRIVMVRMPAFGLDGPWRNNVGFAQTMEQMTGMAWVTGHEYDQPRIPRGPCDPLAGMHSAFAMLAGLRQRDQTDRGSFIEVSMVEAALNAAAEQVVEFTACGNLISRLGNRSRDAAPQGLYQCAGTERWLAISIATDEQWRLLKSALCEPDWANDPALDTHEGRVRAHDVIDKHLELWAGHHDSSAAAELLVKHGVPAADLVDARIGSMHPQLAARGFFESLDHPIVGRHHVPAIPFKYRSVDKWYRSTAPTLGQHNASILGDLLGVDAASIAALTEKGVIGTRPGGLD